MAEMVRMNIRVSKKMSDWMEEVFKETGVPKTTQIMLALESYYQQQKAMEMMGGFQEMINKLDTLEKKLDEQKK